MKNASGSPVLPPRGAEDCLFIIDLSGYVFRAYHAISPLSNSKGEPTHAVMGTVNMLQKVVNERGPHLLAVAMDSPGKTFREDLDVRYKQNRPPPPADLSMQMQRCEEIVHAYNILVARSTGMEADDLIAALTARALEEKLRVVVVSSDKDLTQLVRDDDDRVLLWDSMRDKVYGAAEVRAKFGVPPSLMGDFLALTGDTSDNIPGVPGVGPKTASELLLEFGSLDRVYANLDRVKRPKIRESLATHEADARVSRELVRLRADAAVDWNLDKMRYGGADEAALRRIFLELEFTRLLDSVRPPPPKARAHTCIVHESALAEALAKAHASRAIALHLETTSPEATRASLIGLAFAPTPDEGYYVPLQHRYLGAPKQLAWDAVRALLAPILADRAICKVGHELKYGAIVLERHGLAVDGPIFDTQIASYLLDPESPHTLRDLARRHLDLEIRTYEDVAHKSRTVIPFEQLEVAEGAAYAAEIPPIVLELRARLEPRIERDELGPLLRDVELPLSRVLAQMERTGVLVDTGRLAKVSTHLEAELVTLEAQAKAIVGRDFAVRSRDQLERILFDELKLPVLKRTPKGGRSTDAAVLEELSEKHPLPKIICAYRELDKLKGTYLDALPRCVNPETGRIHTRFDQAVAATGRLSSSDPNLQNIPIRSDVGREIRSAFVAPPGYRIVSADYSQIELRVLAHLSQDDELARAFRENEDVHTLTASLVFDVPKSEVSREMRARAKTINFGVIYGMGDSALAKQLGISRDEAARFIAAYFTRYSGVAAFMERTVHAADRGEAVRTLLGRRRFLPNLHSPNRGLRAEAERVAKNTPIQGTAADILKVAMVKLGSERIADGARMVLTVHDELVFEVPESQVARAKLDIQRAMETAVSLSVPLRVDVGDGANWNEAH